METQELQKKTDAELVELLAEKREEVRKSRFGLAGSAMRNTRALRTLRHEVAQVLTEINARKKVGA